MRAAAEDGASNGCERENVVAQMLTDKSNSKSVAQDTQSQRNILIKSNGWKS